MYSRLPSNMTMAPLWIPCKNVRVSSRYPEKNRSWLLLHSLLISTNQRQKFNVKIGLPRISFFSFIIGTKNPTWLWGDFKALSLGSAGPTHQREYNHQLSHSHSLSSLLCIADWRNRARNLHKNRKSLLNVELEDYSCIVTVTLKLHKVQSHFCATYYRSMTSQVLSTLKSVCITKG